MLSISVPALVKILVTFGIMLGLSRFVPLYASLIAGSVTIGIWMAHSLPSIIECMWKETTASSSLWLALVIALILVLSNLLGKSGQQDRIVSSFQAISPGRRFTLAMLPALIGLLPMPGGALFSAPMVDAALGNDSVKPELKVAINYWFRHIWEYWWPLYPGIILSMSLFSVNPWKLVAAQSPLTVGSIIAGMLFILSLVPRLDTGHPAFAWSNFREFLREVTPIALVVVVLFGLQGTIGVIERVLNVSVWWPQYLSFSLALVASITVVITRNSMGAAAIGPVLFNLGVLRMVLIVLGIMAFKGVLIKSGAIEQVRVELAEYHIPPLVVISFLPFIAGLVTGIAIGFVGVSFPLVVTLVPQGHSPFPYAVLAFGFGYMGMMLSPLHICLIVTKEYFCADLLEGYHYLWKPVLFSVAWTVGLFAVYSLVLG